MRKWEFFGRWKRLGWKARLNSFFGFLGVAGLTIAAAACSPDATQASAQASASQNPAVVTSETPEPIDPTTITIASLKGPTTMGLMGVIATEGQWVDDYQITMYGSPDEVVPLVAQGAVDVAMVPSNLAAVLYSKTAGSEQAVQVAAVNTLGVLNIVEASDTVASLADLRGKTVYTTGKGASPEYVLNYLLGAAGLTAGVDVDVQYLPEHTEVVGKIATTPGAIGLLPQPFVTIAQTQNPDLRVALDLTEEWAAVAPDSQLITGVMVVRTGFAQEYPEALARFLEDYQASVEWVNAEPELAAPLLVEAGIVPNEAVGVTAIPLCYITYLTGTDMKTALAGYLGVLFEANPAPVGGALPGDDFYYAGRAGGV